MAAIAIVVSILFFFRREVSGSLDILYPGHRRLYK